MAHVLPSGPLARKVRAGETIVALDGRPVRLAADLAAGLAGRFPGTPVSLRVEDVGGEPREVTADTAPGFDPEGALGVSLVTRGPRVDGPFEVRVQAGDIGGPSAGLAIALEIVDRRDPAALAGARRVAATGAGGRVGPVGGIAFKVWAADRESVDLLLVPAANYEEAVRASGRLRVAG